MENVETFLNRGQLVPPNDTLTANGLEIWRMDPPMYHDLLCVSYTANDVREWLGRFKKYKAEILSYADKCRNLYKEITEYQQTLAKSGQEFEEYEQRIQFAVQQEDEAGSSFKSELAKKNLAKAELLQIKKARDQILKEKTTVSLETEQIQTRIGYLKTEVEQNRTKHLAALGEKERLNLERRWFFRERLLLEETTRIEAQDIALMKEKLEKLRHCLHKAWEGSKGMDLFGHLRATKNRAYNEDWYNARRRTFTRQKTGYGSRYIEATAKEIEQNN